MGIFDKVSKHIEEMSGDTLVELQEAKTKGIVTIMQLV